MILADNGSSWFITGTPSDRWDNDDLHSLTRIAGSNFEAVDLTPIVSNIEQTSGPADGGTRVTITGLNYSGAAGMLQVLFDGTPGTNLVVASDGSVSATSPAHAAGTIDITVQSPYGTSAKVAGDQFTYTQTVLPPAVPLSPTPASGSKLQLLRTMLNWPDSAGATSYDVFIDNVFQANVTTSQWTFAAPPSFNVEHVWQIVAKGPGGSTAGPNWTYEIDPIKADANADGMVDVTDFKIVNDHFGQTGDWSTGDFSGDGIINFVDFQILELNFGNRTTAPAAPVWASASVASVRSKPRANFSIKPIPKPQPIRSPRRDAGFALR